MRDDRLPMLLVILDGLGDRACDALCGRTPCEAARTPTLDALVASGLAGLHVPFGPGRSTSSERAHWALFGYGAVPFPGRAALELAGVGGTPPVAVPHFHLALRHGRERNGKFWLGERARRGDDDDAAAALFDALRGREVDGIQFQLEPLRTGEAVLVARGATSHAISDTDALFDHIHPWMRPLPLVEAGDDPGARALASAMERWLQAARVILREHPVNADRVRNELPPLDVPVTKWASWLDPGLPNFREQVGVSGGAVTDTALYRGLARLLSMPYVDVPFDAEDVAGDMVRRVREARALLDEHAFVHLHIKATDEAGHRKDPLLKRDVIESVDRGLAELPDLAKEAVVAVTGDHATPSVSALLHSGDPTPLLVAAPGLRADPAQAFGERTCLHGELGTLAAADVLPLMAGLANRPSFLGHRPGARWSVALPDDPEPMSLEN